MVTNINIVVESNDEDKNTMTIATDSNMHEDFGRDKGKALIQYSIHQMELEWSTTTMVPTTTKPGRTINTTMT